MGDEFGDNVGFGISSLFFWVGSFRARFLGLAFGLAFRVRFFPLRSSSSELLSDSTSELRSISNSCSITEFKSCAPA